jgi:hypothetical protein
MREKELIEQLKKVNQELPVYCASTTGEYEYGIAHSVNVTELNIFNEEEDETECLIIEEE